MTTDLNQQARELLLGQDAGTLSTHSADCPGYPFGSLVPLGFDDFSRPIILISRLAQHTRNLIDNPKLSLMVSDVADLGNQDVQSCARLTLLAEAKKLNIEAKSEASTLSRYCRFYPQAESYYKELDFDFYRLEPEKVRFIAGFGKIHWLQPAQLFTQNPFAGVAETEICAHMNSDHADALLRYCQQAAVTVPEGVKPVMVSVDAYGFHQRIGARVLRFEFPATQPLVTANDVRRELIAMLP